MTVYNDSDLLKDSVGANKATASQITFGVIYILLMCFGIVFNSATLHVFCKTDRLKTPTNVLFIGCVICDLMMVCLGFPFVTASFFQGYWIFGQALCEGYGFFMTFLGVTSILILTGIALDRYYAITKSNMAQQLTVFKASMVIVVCFGIGLFWATFPFVWDGYFVEISGVSCGPDWGNKAMSQSSYTISLFVLVFVLPVGVMIFCYVNIMIKVRRLNRLVATTEQTDIVHRARQAKEVQVAASVFIIILLFLIAWTPYAALAMWSVVNDASQISETIAVFAPLLAKSASVWNSLVFVARNTEFLQSFRHVYVMRPLLAVRQTRDSRSPARPSMDQIPGSSQTNDYSSSKQVSLKKKTHISYISETIYA